jgi:hypothetical protein
VLTAGKPNIEYTDLFIIHVATTSIDQNTNPSIFGEVM